jgi:polyhydroxyalkanoate synthesis regulator phasin
MRKELLDWIDNYGEGVKKMFDQQKVAQEVFNLTKNYWTTTMDMMSTFQEQNEKVWNTLLDQGLVAQNEGKKMLQDWLNRSKQAQEQFTKTMEDNWKKAETAFGSTKTTK